VVRLDQRPQGIQSFCIKVTLLAVLAIPTKAAVSVLPADAQYQLLEDVNAPPNQLCSPVFFDHKSAVLDDE